MTATCSRVSCSSSVAPQPRCAVAVGGLRSMLQRLTVKLVHFKIPGIPGLLDIVTITRHRPRNSLINMGATPLLGDQSRVGGETVEEKVDEARRLANTYTLKRLETELMTDPTADLGPALKQQEDSYPQLRRRLEQAAQGSSKSDSGNDNDNDSDLRKRRRH